MMEEKSTFEVEEILKNMKPSELGSFYKENSHSMIDEKKAFYYYMKDIVDSKGVFLKDMYMKAGVSESYGEKIIRMESHTKNRDLIIRLCIAGLFSLDETNIALKLYGFNELYSKVKRDACILLAIHKRIYDMYKIDDMLIEQGLSKLTVE